MTRSFSLLSTIGDGGLIFMMNLLPAVLKKSIHEIVAGTVATCVLLSNCTILVSIGD